MIAPIICSLKQIAAWDLENLDARHEDIKASVPALQRGLVWSPGQVELLWDSILRGFPIGCFVACKKVQDQERSEKMDVTHHLLDGQQRVNAITLGFHDPFSDISHINGGENSGVRGNVSESIIWLDLNPSDNHLDTNTREFLVRVTTLAHPWGYQKDDGCKRLSTSEIQKSLKEWGGQRGQRQDNKRPHPNQLEPFVSSAPIPLAWLMNAYINEIEEDSFWGTIKDRLSNCHLHWAAKSVEIIGRDCFIEGKNKIYNAIKIAAQTKLVILCAPDNIGSSRRYEDRNCQAHLEGISNIEHLFNRLNRQGTPLNGEELSYSMIKAYWPKFDSSIYELKNQRVPASQLVSLAVRVALSDLEKQLPGRISISRLRNISTSVNGKEWIEKNAIEKFIQDGSFKHSVERVDNWLSKPKSNILGMPPVLISSFARSSTDLYLIFLIIATRIKGDLEGEFTDIFIGIATVTHWLSVDDKSKIAASLFDCIRTSFDPSTIAASLKEELNNLIKISRVARPLSPNEIDKAINIENCTDADLKYWQWPWDKEANDSTYDCIKKLLYQKEFLLFAQRKFLNDEFPSYDPSRKDLWESHNRPWDFDHIHASYYFYNRKNGDFADFCRRFGNTIGNLRAWPFQDNRSDQAVTAITKLKDSQIDQENSLLKDFDLKAFSGGDQTRTDAESARKLALAIKSRFLRIYADWYECAEIGKLIDEGSVISTSIL